MSLLICITLCSCSTQPAPEPKVTIIDYDIVTYEKECVPYQQKIIDGKAWPSPEKKQAFVDSMFKNYVIAKDKNNSDEVRKSAINQALMLCNIQKKLNIN